MIQVLATSASRSRTEVVALRVAIATVWLTSGVAFKLLGVVPRHRMIVAAVVGEAAAGPLTLVVGAAEACLGLWMLSGIWPRSCAATQTLALAVMNTLELAYARELLLAPGLMVCANVALLAAAWYVACRIPAPPVAA